MTALGGQPAMSIPLPDLLLFILACIVLVVTPGPNMLYLLSRAICQGRAAGMISLAGVIAGFIVHMLCAAVGLSALLVAVPVAFDAVKFAGALYLLWMAWDTVRPGARSPLEPRALPAESPRALFMKGLLINLLNPKVAMFYLALFPQFVDPARGSVLLQSMALGGVQIAISILFDVWMIATAAAIARWFVRNPAWMAAQRWVMGGVLAALAVRIALEPQHGG
jgi:threonine/homoserine/homoserine lactone efflux protein